MDSSLETRRVGLRDRQKQERERRIVKAAEKLFARKGYAEVAMEDVAARAGLAVGTIYNYFPSKSALLLAIVRRETESMVARGRKILDDPPRDPVAAVSAFTEILLEDFTRDDRRLWRELFGAAIVEPSTVGRRLFEADAQLVSQFASLLEQYRSNGVLASDIEPLPAATVLYGVCFTWMTAYLMNDAITSEMVRNEIRRGTAIAMRGLFPRAAPISKEQRCLPTISFPISGIRFSTA
jgi:AcrR family transcriptional regulator